MKPRGLVSRPEREAACGRSHCNNPEALTTDEMCAQQGSPVIDVGTATPPTPRPDPRTRAR
jgi:hypothetical protein